MRAVNLLPREDADREKQPLNLAAVVGAAGGLLVVASLAVASLAAGHSVDNRRQALGAAKTELAATPPATQSSASRSRTMLMSERERRAVALATALTQRTSWDRVLRRFALVLPDDVWLTSLSGSTPVASPTTPTAAPTQEATPTGLTLQGYSYSHDAVARLLSRLAVVPDLTNVQLQTSKVTELAGRKVVQFTILADVHRGGDAT